MEENRMEKAWLIEEEGEDEENWLNLLQIFDRYNENRL